MNQELKKDLHDVLNPLTQYFIERAKQDKLFETTEEQNDKTKN